MIRLYNATIAPMTSPDKLIEEGEIWIEDDKITYVGPTPKEIPEADQALDLEGDLILPGFKNAHTHSAMTFLRSYADDLPLHEWLQKQVFPMEAKLQGDDVYWLTILGIMEYLTSGITANFDMYMFPEEIAKATIDTGFRTVLCGTINDFGGTVEEEEQRYLKFNDLNPLLSYMLGFHAEYTTKLETLEGLAELAKRYKAPMYTHNSETQSEVDDCIERHGKTPTELFSDLGLYDYGGGGFHCIYLSENDIRIFQERGLHIVSNPGSNCKLASGVAPLTTYREAGINLALGTDGPASNNALDFFREMYLAAVLQKLKLDDAAAMPALEVLKMATVGGAKAMGLEDCDTLEAGKQADLQVLSMQQPNFQPKNDILKNVVYSGSKSNVRLTMVAGKILYRDGEYFIGKDPAEVYAKANQIIRRMEAEA